MLWIDLEFDRLKPSGPILDLKGRVGKPGRTKAKISFEFLYRQGGGGDAGYFG